MDGNSTNIEAYGRIADAYHKSTKDLDMGLQWDLFLDMLPGGADILDVCCGAGRDAKEFTRRGFHVTGLDAVSELLSIAADEAPRAQFVQGDARTFDLKRTYDGVWCNTGIFMFPHDEVPGVLENIAAHLDEGDPLYINFKIGEGQGAYDDARYGVRRFESYFTPDMFREVLEERFDIVREHAAYGQNRSYRTHPIQDVWCRKKGGGVQ